MTLLKPVYIGNALILSTRLNYVKRYFMEVAVKAEGLNIREAVLTGTALVTIVALEHGKPIEVNPLILKSDEDKKRFHEGESKKQEGSLGDPLLGIWNNMLWGATL